MEVLIIGATGFIGSHVGRRLLADGHRVTGLTRSADKRATLAAAGFRCLIGDVEDPASAAEIADAADVIVFAPQLLADQEYEVVSRLLGRLEGTGKTFIFTSGTGVIGQRTGGAWSQDSFAEDDSFNPLKAIARRVDTETLVRAAAGRGMRAMVMRPPRVWGHGARGHISMVYESVGVSGSACYIGQGFNMYSNVHIDDLAELYARVVLRGTAGALYHAVCGEIANRWIAESVAHDMGCETRSVSMDEAMEIWGRYQTLIVLGVSSRSRAVRSRDELGWVPKRLDMLEEVGLESFRALAMAQRGQPIFHGRASTLLAN
jgi:nucleoside-diphosphate-sugar epimerase